MDTRRKKRVLIALDYNITAQKVAEIGYTLGKAMDGEIVLLHVVTIPAYYIDTKYSPEMRSSEHLEAGRQQLNNNDTLKKVALGFLNKSKEHLGDQSILTRIEEGDSAETILKTAREMHADVLVMGSHSKRRLEKILMGSVTEKVLLLTRIPLIIVPTHSTKKMELFSVKRMGTKTDAVKEKFKEDYQ